MQAPNGVHSESDYTMSNLKSVWYRKATQRFQSRKHAHETGAPLNVLTAWGSQLDELGQRIGTERNPNEPDSEYREDLLVVMKDELNYLTSNWEDSTRTTTLDVLASLAGSSRDFDSDGVMETDAALHRRLCAIVFAWFRAQGIDHDVVVP